MATATTERQSARRKWLRRIGWLVLLWAASVAALAVVTLLLRQVMGWAGLSR